MILSAFFFIASALAGPPASAHHPVSTKDVYAQQLFDRGLTLFYAYNGSEGARVFTAMQERDPACAMAYWGEALSVGPDINTAMTQSGFEAGHKAIEQAARREAGATPQERTYIDAMRLRYAGPWVKHEAAEAAYVKAVAAAVAKTPSDEDLSALYAEALLERRTVTGLWKEGTTVAQSEDTLTIAALLSRILSADPGHLMANHLTIHVFESSADHSRAVTSAKRIDAMAFLPEDEHLAHMPAHTWIDIGDYAKAVASSQRAIALFDTYLATANIDSHHESYLEHDISVGFGAALMNDRYEDAQWFAKRLATSTHSHSAADFAAMRFQHWSDLTRTPKSPGDPAHFAFAYDKLEHGDPYGAKAELSDALDAGSNRYLLYALRAGVAAMQGKPALSQEQFQKALYLEHAEYTGETLPDFPAAELMGNVYAKLGDYQRAANAYRNALQSYPNEAHARNGLAAALKHLAGTGA